MHLFPLPFLLLMSVALSVSGKKRIYTGCGAEMTDVLEGFIDYPGEGHNYPNNAKCEWKITISEGKRFQVSFLRFATDNHKDILLVKNGKSGTSIGQFFGKNYNPAEFETAGNELWFHFSSDAMDTNKGFQLIWNTIDTKGDIEERLHNLEVELQSINHHQNSTHSKLDFLIEHLDYTPPDPPTNGECPGEKTFEEIEGTCYYFSSDHGEKLTWDQARKFCQDLSGLEGMNGRIADLAELRSESSFMSDRLLMEKIAQKGAWAVWLCGSDAESENSWIWVNSGRSLPVQDSFWEPSQPNVVGSSSGNCLVGFKAGHHGRCYFGDWACNKQEAFVCQIF